MTTTFLAYFPSPPRGVWHLGPLPIRAYALFIIAGILVTLLIGDRRFVARGGERGVVYDIALWCVPFGLVGGRLYHLATDWQTYFGQDGAGMAAALRVWDGGLGIWGAIALGVVGAWIGCRRRGIPLPAFLDALAPGVILAQAIGRLGNYFNQELYGRETAMPWGLEIFYRRDPAGFVDVRSLDGVSTGQLAFVVQPTFLYELLWNVLVFVVLIYLDRRFVIGHGRLFGLYVAGYCTGRFFIELLRDDTATLIAGIRVNSFTSTFVLIGAVVYVILAPKGREDPATLRGRDHVADESCAPALTSEVAVVGVASATTESVERVEVEAEAGSGVAEVGAGAELGSGESAESAERVDESAAEQDELAPVSDDDTQEPDEQPEPEVEAGSGVAEVGAGAELGSGESAESAERVDESAAEQDELAPVSDDDTQEPDEQPEPEVEAGSGVAEVGVGAELGSGESAESAERVDESAAEQDELAPVSDDDTQEPDEQPEPEVN
ncbi:prolipoprotein diacylglyceryl transferase [Mycobacterium sp.]|uniref:prolipoprotein diacylglyceryl transferase n=1 Tax=Mycobacterium sp. TaxID=1785 RepID=UPI003BAB143D